MISLLILLGLLCYFAYELMVYMIGTAIGVGIVILVVILGVICGKSKKKE